jgi:phospholipid-binding lipoprotein MlaA
MGDSRPKPANAVVVLGLLVTVGLSLAAGVATAESDADVADPWEGMNRGIFWFNEGVDRWVAEPIAKGVDFITPDPVERAIRRFFVNTLFPMRFVNDLLQAKPVAAAEDLARFVVNTTVGIAGFFDPASKFGLEGHTEDFGQTLGYWGVPPGPYLVLPFIGPSNPRDGFGLIADSAARVYPFFVTIWISAAITGTELVNRRSLALDTIAAEREAALDYYVAVRNAYTQYRENQVRDRAEEEPGTDDDLYYFEPEDRAAEPDERANLSYREPGSTEDLAYPDRSVER